MCNLYSLGKQGPDALRAHFAAERDETGNMQSLPAIFPKTMAPVVLIKDGVRTLTMKSWGMPSPRFVLESRSVDPGVTNVRNVASPHWRRWLGPESRCLVPLTAFSEFDKATREDVWFAVGEDRPTDSIRPLYANRQPPPRDETMIRIPRLPHRNGRQTLTFDRVGRAFGSASQWRRARAECVLGEAIELAQSVGYPQNKIAGLAARIYAKAPGDSGAGGRRCLARTHGLLRGHQSLGQRVRGARAGAGARQTDRAFPCPAPGQDRRGHRLDRSRGGGIEL